MKTKIYEYVFNEEQLDEVGTSKLDYKLLNKPYQEEDVDDAYEEASKILDSKGGKSFGAGSSRDTYMLTSKRIMKLAMNDKGLAQNEEELRISKEIPALTTKIFAFGPSDSKVGWLVSELVKELTNEKEFEQLAGISFGAMNAVLTSYAGSWSKAVEKAMPILKYNYKEYIDLILNPTGFIKLVKDGLEKKLMPADLTVLEHWGKTTDGRIVLLDYGFTKDVQKKHYSDIRIKKTEDSNQQATKPQRRKAPPVQQDATGEAPLFVENEELLEELGIIKSPRTY